MTDKELADRFRDYDEERLRQMAWRHGYGKMSSHYWDRVQKGLKESTELEEGIKDWAKQLAAAGIIVGAVAGVGSINNAIDNSVPAIQAMNTALEFAQDQGNEELAKMIEKDLKDAKLRLDIGRDLNHVKHLQDKYAKFLPNESIQNTVSEDKKPKPTNPSKWAYYKGQAKKKFDVYPSAYANAWAAKMYKKAGGGWR